MNAPDLHLVLHADSRPIMSISGPDAAAGRTLTIFGEDGERLVEISLRTGAGTLLRPDRVDEAARRFWEGVFVMMPGKP